MSNGMMATWQVEYSLYYFLPFFILVSLTFIYYTIYMIAAVATGLALLWAIAPNIV